MKSILLVKKCLGLVEMMSGLVNASSSLPEWQAVKMIFFAPCQESDKLWLVGVYWLVENYFYPEFATISQKCT